MSLYRWLNDRENSDSPLLPVAGDATTSATNKEVEQEMASTLPKRGKRGSYVHYDEETRAKIARYAVEHGNKAAISKFSVELGKPLAESTVRNMKKSWYLKLREEPDPDKITCLPRANRGRPLMLGSYDQEVAKYIKSLRIAGGIVNRSIVIAAARGIVSH